MKPLLRVVSHNLAITSLSYDGTMTSMLPGIRLRVPSCPRGKVSDDPQRHACGGGRVCCCTVTKSEKIMVNQRMKWGWVKTLVPSEPQNSW